MKTCPSCSNDFYRRVKDCCPLCHTPLLLINGILRITEDKLIVDAVMTKIKEHIKERDHVEMPFVDRESNRERKFAYELIDRTKRFLSAQREKVAISVREFVLGLIDYILSLPRIARKINSLLYLYNAITDLARDYFLMLREQAITSKAEKHRLQIYQQSEVVISYGI